VSDTLPFFAAETGTYSSTGPVVSLSGSAPSLGTYPVRTFAAAAADTTIAFDSGNTCTVVIAKDASNYKRYTGAVWTDASPDTIGLSTATLEGSAGTISDSDALTVYGVLPTKFVQANTHESPDTDSATTALHHTIGTGANQACAGNDSRLSNARTPTAHASTHATGQADALTAANIGAEPAQTAASQAEAEAGTETAIRKWSPVTVFQAIAAKLAAYAGAITASSLSLNQNISQSAWTTNGVRVKNYSVTLTDTSSSGTVAAAYSNRWGGNTIAASNSVTYTDYATHYFEAPVAGPNVTIPNAYTLISNGNVKISGKLVGPEVKNYTETLYTTTSSGNITIDLANGNFQRFTLDAARQFTMPPDPGAVAQSFVLLIDCAGFTPTWNTSPPIKWLTADGNAPTLVTTSGKRNVLSFIWDDSNAGTGYWLGFLAGKET
jgi:hypothetical protein